MEDYLIQAEEAATDVGECMGPSTGGADPCGEYAILKCWYSHASAQAPNPSQTDIQKVRGDIQII